MIRQDTFNSKVTLIKRISVKYVNMCAFYRMQNDPYYMQMENESLMLLNLIYSVDGYDISSDLMTENEIRLTLELIEDIIDMYYQHIKRIIYKNVSSEYKVKDYDGNEYDVVKILNKYWITQNLRVTHFANGVSIPNVTNDDQWRFGYDQNCLYNGYAAFDSRNIFSAGWHLMTLDEFNTLKAYCSSDANKIKTPGKSLWADGNLGTNEYGLNTVGMGYISNTGLRIDPFAISRYWINSGLEGYYLFFMLSYDSSAMNYGGGGDDVLLKDGYSLIGVKDVTTLSHGQTGEYVGNDGKIYNTICIGTKEYISEQLRETKFRNGDVIPVVSSSLAWSSLTAPGVMNCYFGAKSAYCWYDNNPGYKEYLGAIYNQFVPFDENGIVYFTRNGIHEEGWRIPSESDITELISYLGGAIASVEKLFEENSLYWDYPAIDSVGLKFRGAGVRSNYPGSGSSSGIKSITKFALSDYNEVTLLTRNFICEGYTISFTNQILDNYGISIRCIRELPT